MTTKTPSPTDAPSDWVPYVTELRMTGSYRDMMPSLLKQASPFILESGLASEPYGRYTFMGSNPFMTVTANGDRVTIEKPRSRTTRRGNPFDILADLLHDYHIVENKSGLPFVGGAVGYLGYDLGRCIEKIPEQSKQDMDFPDMVVGFYNRVLVHDHQEEKTFLVELADKRGRKPAHLMSNGSDSKPARASSRKPLEFSSNFTREAYLAAVKRAKEYIAAGDIYQVNLSQRFETPRKNDPWTVYTSLRDISPAPYSAYLQTGAHAVISSSPEQFLEVSRSTIITRPIKGTRRRGTTPEEDQRLKEELIGSPKDDAELAMIVDLERNDLGRVCVPGSVRVVQPKILETHPTIFHLSSTIQGTLNPDTSVSQILKAVFPGGSVTGAPKIRAMKIIEELEPTRRSVYTGAFGTIGFDGDMNLGMAIRTILADESRYTFQVGGAIVADSDPEMEYQETLIKGAAIIKALSRP